jgi:hypothetical protein
VPPAGNDVGIWRRSGWPWPARDAAAGHVTEFADMLTGWHGERLDD